MAWTREQIAEFLQSRPFRYAEFREEDHPRDDAGKFSETPWGQKEEDIAGAARKRAVAKDVKRRAAMQAYLSKRDWSEEKSRWKREAEKELETKEMRRIARKSLTEYMREKGVPEDSISRIIKAPSSAFGRRVGESGSTVSGPESLYRNHYVAVKSALDAGIDVPAEVLADYPEMKK